MQFGAGSEFLTDLSFDLEPGSLHFRTGSIGAGKSSLLKIIYLVQPPSRGTVSVSGGEQRLVAVARAIGTRILYLFEELNRMGTTVLIATHNDELAFRFDYPRLHRAGHNVDRHGDRADHSPSCVGADTVKR